MHLNMLEQQNNDDYSLIIAYTWELNNKPNPIRLCNEASSKTYNLDLLHLPLMEVSINDRIDDILKLRELENVSILTELLQE